MKAALIGTPVSHSLSPAIFGFLTGFLAGKTGTSDFHYSAQEVQPADLLPFLSEAKANSQSAGLVGFNVTIPHKETVLSLLDQVSVEVKSIGAANVIHCHQGKLLGYNTDVLGITRTLEEQHCLMRDQTALIWGAGGAARAVAYALGTMGAKTVYVSNREQARAHKLAVEIGTAFPKTSFIATSDPGAVIHPPHSLLRLLVNATPVSPPDLQGNELAANSSTLAFDLSYNPEVTSFLEDASAQGLKTVGGLDMLIYQALATWEIWFGPLQRFEETKTALARHLRSRPIFLTGFMGVGKTTIGGSLAKKLGWQFVDTDKLIQEETGLSIPELFKNKGEPAFRELEKNMITKVVSRTKTIVSLGGGALMNPENLNLIQKSGSLVYLSASAETLIARLGAGTAKRPLLAGHPEESAERIRALLEIREPIYNRARIKIKTDGKTSVEIADRILKLVPRERA